MSKLLKMASNAPLPDTLQQARCMMKFKRVSNSLDNHYHVCVDVGIGLKVELRLIGMVSRTTKGVWTARVLHFRNGEIKNGTDNIPYADNCPQYLQYEYVTNHGTAYTTYEHQIAVFKNRYQAGQALISYLYGQYESIQNIALNF